MKRREFLKQSERLSLEGIILFSSAEKIFAKSDSTGELLWKYSTGGKIIMSSPAIDSNGTIYIGSFDNNLHAINPDGTPKWKFSTSGRIYDSPAIDKENTIYIGSEDSKIYAINPDGSLKWDFPTKGLIFSSPVVGSNGTIYAGYYTPTITNVTYGIFYAIAPDGTEKWRFPKEGEMAGIRSTPAIARDGTIYVGTHAKDKKNFFAINPDGTLKWDFQADGWLDGGVAIDKDDTIYLLGSPQTLYALDPDGSLKWRYDAYGGYPQSSPVISEDRRIYFNCGGNLIALDHNGNFIHANFAFANDRSSPVIASDGMIYTGCGGFIQKTGEWNYGLIAVEPSNLSTIWSYKTGTGVFVGDMVRSSPIINNGIVYFATDAGFLYAVDTGTKANLANTPWPMFGQNLRHTSNASDYDGPVSVDEILNETPNEFYLKQNRPNPFNPITTIEYNLPRDTNARLEIYNSNGQLVDVLFDEFQTQGHHQVTADLSNKSSGAYFYRLRTPGFSKTEKMMLVK